MPFRQVADGRQVGQIAVHREHPVRGDQAVARIGRLLQLFFEVLHVVVGVAEALRAAKAHAVDDRRVVQRVGYDRVLLAQEALEQPGVGVEATREEDGVLGSQERAQAFLQLLVRNLGAADEPHRRHPETIPGQRGPRRLDEAGVVGEAQVVVGAQVDAGGARLERHLALLRRGDDLFLLEQAVGLERFDPAGQIVEKRIAHRAALKARASTGAKVGDGVIWPMPGFTPMIAANRTGRPRLARGGYHQRGRRRDSRSYSIMMPPLCRITAKSARWGRMGVGGECATPPHPQGAVEKPLLARN